MRSQTCVRSALAVLGLLAALPLPAAQGKQRPLCVMLSDCCTYCCVGYFSWKGSEMHYK